MAAKFTASRTEDSESVALINEDKKVQTPSEIQHGLNVVTTCVFIIGVIAGSGFLALPKTIDDAGWIGFVLIFLCCFVSAYTGSLLGECWTMTQDRCPALKQGSARYPYPAIGEVAFGRLGRNTVSFSINFTQFGSTVVYVLLAADNIVKLLPESTKYNCCDVILVVVLVVTPFTWFGTPKEFWGIAAIASTATATASFVLLGAIVYHGSEIDYSEVRHTDVDVISFFTAYGTICFAYNGHACFPTFQSDMKNPKYFGKALVLGYSIVMLMYAPCTVAAYFVYGKEVQPNMLNTLPGGPTTTIVSSLMTAHLLFGIVIVINPVTQEIEHLINIPERFTWKRVVSRTLMMVLVLFVAVSVPHFSSILSLVGGSTISILSFLCPSLFYLKLCRGSETTKERSIPLYKRVILYEIILTGLIAGVAATYSAIADLAINKFTVPCYVDAQKACSS